MEAALFFYFCYTQTTSIKREALMCSFYFYKCTLFSILIKDNSTMLNCGQVSFI